MWIPVEGRIRALVAWPLVAAFSCELGLVLDRFWLDLLLFTIARPFLRLEF